VTDFTELNHPQWPARAVVTAGMPYGNKALHFGHVGGVFVPADCFSRFLKDRIGAQNVRFISGTDCFGSPIDEGYRKLKEAGEFDGTINDYVMRNHNAQLNTLKAYDIDLSIFDGSGIGHAGEVHQELTNAVLTRLYENAWLKRISTMQFYDTQAQTFLNGRQVMGKCPYCTGKNAGEHGYADECDMGHQYAPEDLINPVSSVTGTIPEMRPVENWYFDLPAFAGYLDEFTKTLEADPEVRAVVSQTIREFLVPPIIYIKNELFDEYEAVKAELPAHTYRAAEGNKQSFELEFANVDDRDQAKLALGRAGVKYRSGKALVPFRITGNIEWGVEAPAFEGVDGLTVWCWPETLWAPISFTMACNDAFGLPVDSWQDFWCAEDACVYQFIGQDNLYFYGVAQPALFEALRTQGVGRPGGTEANLRQSKLVANHHVLFGTVKASSSSAVKPPSADALLDYYTPEQLRAHWLALGLDQKSVGFSPKPFDPNEKKRNDPRVSDPALKESALLTNVFNRLARSCFYEAQNNFGGMLPVGDVTPAVVEQTQAALLEYETIMHRAELHTAFTQADEYIRAAQTRWNEGVDAAGRLTDEMSAEERAAALAARKQVLIDCAYMLHAATMMMHPIVPRGCEKIREYLQIESTLFYNWDMPLVGLVELFSDEDVAAGGHALKELPPKTDFFRKHESQYK